MESERKWIIVRIDGKIAGVSNDYRILARISSQIVTATSPLGTDKHSDKHSDKPSGKQSGRNGGAPSRDNAVQTQMYAVPYQEVTASVATAEEIWDLRKQASWEDLMLFGTEFQKKVWRKLWELTHPVEGPASAPRLISYSDFAELCQNRAGVRAVAHAIGKNPISVIIPCHLVIPKESIDKIVQIQKKAETTIFKGEDLCLDSILLDKSIDFGEYSLGRRLKRDLIIRELCR